MSNIYEVDIRFLKPLITAYKLGLFENKGLPVRVMNALDSLSEYSYIEKEVVNIHPIIVKPVRKRKKYTKRSEYWRDTSSNKRNSKP